ncbi:MAG TPA: hypothetical protein VLA96_14400 [Terriglobales bacterium]|nr:hypothetical protein [Terriglobales bacterium]
MDLLHFHLVLNHVPVIGMGIVLLLLVGALLRRSAELMRATLVLIVVLGLAALGAFFTGEPAEDGVEHLPGISKATISAHEEAAELALAAMETLAVIALLGLLMWARRPAVPGWFVTVIVLGAIVTSGAMGYTANLGGKIRHTELGVTNPAATGSERD